MRHSSRFVRRADAGNVFPFDAHYRWAGSYCQQMNPWPRTVPRLVGAQCPRIENDAEDHACWMATLFTPLRCPGPGGCADPLQCSATLMQHKQGRLRARYSFAPAWRARRAEIVTQANRGESKTAAAKRVSVVHDTTLCKRWASSDIALNESALQRAILHQLCSRWSTTAQCLQRVIDLVL